jgi:hypothetical protein
MSVRTTRSSVTFNSAFRLKGIDQEQPAGTYEIETDEEQIELTTHTGYVRLATLLYLRSAGITRLIAIDPIDLENALVRDQLATNQVPQPS